MPRLVDRRARLLAAGLPLVVALALGSSAALALDAKVDAEAKKAAADAMDNDYLALDLKKAKAKLLKALERCGDAKCAPATLGLLRRDLGVVMAAGKEKGADAELDAALAVDPKGELSKDYLSNPEVKKAWEAAKKRFKPGKPASKPEAEPSALSVKYTTAPVGYELPVVVVVPKGVEAASVKVSFKTATMDKYRALEAQRQGKVWIATIPCAHTGKPGEIEFFVKVFDDAGGELDHKGSVKSPKTLTVVASMPDGEEAPSLPGDKEPKQCDGASDRKPEGAGCGADDECEDGLVCVEGDEEKRRCEAGERTGKKRSAQGPRLFIGVDGQLDFLSVGDTRDLCNQSGWACSAEGVNNVIGRVDLGPGSPITLSNGGKTEGGTTVGTGRVLVTADYFLSPRLSLGVRLGYAFNGNPTKTHSFSPLHAEARAHYFFSEATVRPFLGVGLGYGEIDAKVTGVVVRPEDPAFNDPNVTDVTGAGVIQKVDAYRTTGAGFVSFGSGAWIFVSPRLAINAGLKVIVPFSNLSFAFAPELGVKLGF